MDKEPIYQSVIAELKFNPEQTRPREHWQLPALKKRLLQKSSAV